METEHGRQSCGADVGRKYAVEEGRAYPRTRIEFLFLVYQCLAFHQTRHLCFRFFLLSYRSLLLLFARLPCSIFHIPVHNLPLSKSEYPKFMVGERM